MSTFDWLLREQAAVPLKKFFCFQPKPASCLDEIEARFGKLPQSYKDFVTRFGGADLFRNPTLGYLLYVFAPPEVWQVTGEPIILRLGHFINTGDVCLKWQDSHFVDDASLFTGSYWPNRRFKANFEEWLRTSCQKAKKVYTKKEWSFTLKAPVPFSAEEIKIVEAIPLFKFQKIGITETGSILVEVKNESAMQLPCLTVGVALGSPFRTACYALPTADVKPGTSATIDCLMYPGSVSPDEIELFQLPVPEPEDRPYYWEFSDERLVWNRLTKGWERPSGIGGRL